MTKRRQAAQRERDREAERKRPSRKMPEGKVPEGLEGRYRLWIGGRRGRLGEEMGENKREAERPRDRLEFDKMGLGGVR